MQLSLLCVLFMQQPSVAGENGVTLEALDCFAQGCTALQLTSR